MRWLILVALCLPPRSLAAQSLGLALRAGLTGPGVEISAAASSRVRVRISASYLSIRTDRQVTRGAIPYRIKGDLAAGSASLLVDLDLKANIHLSAGLMTLLTGGSVTAAPTGSTDIAGSVVTPQELGSVSVTSKFPDRPAPYLGLGFGSPVGQSRLSILLDVGVMYAGRPRFSTEAQGLLDASSTWVTTLEQAFRGLRWAPMISLGIGLRVDAPKH
jgi:hypothetical protein